VLGGVLRPNDAQPVRASSPADGEVAAIPARLDVVDKGDRFTVKVDLPGLSKEDITVAVAGDRVSVSGAAKTAVSSANGAQPEQIKVLRSERRALKYARTVQLPEQVDGAAAQAAFENGVLTLTLPKRVQATRITVN
jgi:HSP20 family protein